MKKIRFMNLSISDNKTRKFYKKKFDSFLKSGIFIMGKEVEQFEKDITNYCNSKYAVGVGSGTDALILALKALDITYEDEVIVSDMSFIASANAINMVGAKAVFCDVKNDFNIDTKKIEELISKDTKAIMVVHYGGKMADMCNVMKIAKKFNLKVIEDGSQSFGATYENKLAGTIGNIGCFSLNPMKPLGAFGEAGVITTSCEMLYEKLKILRYNGLDENKKCIYKSHNAKIDTLQAIVLSKKLQSLSKTILIREKYTSYYNKKLKNYVITPKKDENKKDVYFAYTILVDKEYRDNLHQYLSNRGIEVKINHPSMHQELAYLDHNNILQKNSIKLTKMKLSLPCHENLKFKEVKYIAKMIIRFFDEM